MLCISRTFLFLRYRSKWDILGLNGEQIARAKMNTRLIRPCQRREHDIDVSNNDRLITFENNNVSIVTISVYFIVCLRK
jgi:hypothetical protein